MIIKTFLPIVLFFIFIGIAYTNINSASKNNMTEEVFKKFEIGAKVEESDIKKLSLEDQAIIKKYNDKINSLDFRDIDFIEKIMRDNLSEISKIKDDNERSKLQLEIYLSLGMYKEAYELNGKMLKKEFSEGRLIHQCELSYYAQRPKKEYEACHAKLALAVEKEFQKTPKTDPEYIYGEWWYLLSMYKSGHDEYKWQLKKILESMKDDQVKLQLEGSYELAVQQVESYKKLSDD